jgi:hypothetical protein
LVSNSSTKLNKSGESRHPCIIPDFRGNGFSFSPFYDVGYRFVYVAFSMLSTFLLFLVSSSWQDVEFCQRFFSASIDDHMIFVLDSV